MFAQYFGNYLVDKNKISRSQFEDILMKQQSSRLKLGFIAVAEKLLTTRQAEEINDLQKKMDRRFGDLAIEKGYLLNEEVTYLLNMQGNPYLLFVQSLTEANLLTMTDIETGLEDYKKENNFTDADIDALKSGDIDRIIPVFANVSVPFCGECISLTIRNTVRFINNNIMLKKAYPANTYAFDTLAVQKMIGDHQIFVGFAGKDQALLHIAESFAKESFTQMDEDAFDSVCEFINCSNGLYASKLSLDDIHIDMTPPVFYTDQEITSESEFYVVPIVINGAQTDLIVAVDKQIGIK